MKKIIALIASVLLLAGCSSSTTASDLSVTEFSAKIAEVGVITLDVRTPGEFAEEVSICLCSGYILYLACYWTVPKAETPNRNACFTW